MVVTELLMLATETDEERKRLKKMVATNQLRLALETDDERKARLEYLSDNPIYIPNNLYLILIVAFKEVSSLIKLTRTILFRTIHNNYIMHVCTMYVYKYSVDMYLLCMMKAKVRWCTCSLWRMF